LIVAVFFVPEAPLTMQHGVFLFCFFPLMAAYMPPKAPPTGAGRQLPAFRGKFFPDKASLSTGADIVCCKIVQTTRNGLICRLN
jgi:hypothetical protein